MSAVEYKHVTFTSLSSQSATATMPERRQMGLCGSRIGMDRRRDPAVPWRKRKGNMEKKYMEKKVTWRKR
jgi:hypothetical protein